MTKKANVEVTQGKDYEPKKCRRPLVAKKGKETGSPRKSPEGTCTTVRKKKQKKNTTTIDLTY